jgi:hypothetical protein
MFFFLVILQPREKITYLSFPVRLARRHTAALQQKRLAIALVLNSCHFMESAFRVWVNPQCDNATSIICDSAGIVCRK